MSYGGRTVVTGGAGSIGSNLVEELITAGHEVTVLDNLSSGYRSNLTPYPSARLVEGDVRDAKAVAESLRGCGVVFHLAASVGNKRSIDRPIEDAEVNVIGTLRVLEEARVAGIRKIVTIRTASSSTGTVASRIAACEPSQTVRSSPEGVRVCVKHRES